MNNLKCYQVILPITISQKEKRISIFNLTSSQFILTALGALKRIIVTKNMMSISNQQKTNSFYKEKHVKKTECLYDCQDGLI